MPAMLRYASILFVCLFAQLAHAQIFIIPPEHIPIHSAYSLKSLSVDATVKDQVAEVQLAQVVQNLTQRQSEVSFIFPVPPDAVISQFMLLIDGKEVPAKLYTKEEAARIYEGIVRTKKDPALLEFMGYGALQTRIFPLPPGGERKITLRYTQLCRKTRDAVELLVPLAGGKILSRPVSDFNINVRLTSAGRIKSVYSPAFPVSVDRTDEHSATVRWSQNHISLADDFRLIWNLSDQAIGATLLTYRPSGHEDGYFLLLASPEVKASEGKIARKTVIFALDRSGSMAGEKIEQARNALKFVLNNLREGDLFNIIAYDDRVESFSPELQRFSPETRAKAQRFVENIRDGGSTNIDGALRRAMELVGNTGNPSYVIFLTDGLPTAGEQNESTIAANAKRTNDGKARLFAFGVGYDVNTRLLDRLTTENSGASEYVRPSENIESAVAKFYTRITAPVLTSVKMHLDGAEVNRVYPRELPDLFAGGQMVVVGRYRSGAATTLKLTGKVGNVEQTFTYPVSMERSPGQESNAFVEKLWAARRIGDIINELDLKGRNQELIDELVRLSTRHGILTPYTAFLADERTELHASLDNAARADRYLFRDRETSLGLNITGESAVELRANKAALQKQDQVAAGAYSGPSPSAMPSGGGGYGGAANGPLAVRGSDQRIASGRYGGTASSAATRAPAAAEPERVRVAGDKALYKRGKQWIDPAITPEEEKKAETIEQFTDRYFELARNNAKMRQYLSLPDGCIVKLDGRVYRITPPQNTGG